MKSRNTLVLPIVLFLVIATLPAASWLHVRVESDSDEKVRVNIPLSVVNTVLPILQEKGMGPFEHGHGIHFGEEHMNVSDLREIWAAVRSQGSYQIANVEDHDMNVNVYIEGDYLRVESQEGSSGRVDVKVPVIVVDALLSGQGQELNLVAAAQALTEVGEQELVTIDADDTRVRIWIDDRNQ